MRLSTDGLAVWFGQAYRTLTEHPFSTSSIRRSCSSDRQVEIKSDSKQFTPGTKDGRMGWTGCIGAAPGVTFLSRACESWRVCVGVFVCTLISHGDDCMNSDMIPKLQTLCLQYNACDLASLSYLCPRSFRRACPSRVVDVIVVDDLLCTDRRDSPLAPASRRTTAVMERPYA